MITETFSGLLRDRAHWEFEIFLMLLFDGLLAGLLFPLARKAWKAHIATDWSMNEIARAAGHQPKKNH